MYPKQSLNYDSIVKVLAALEYLKANDPWYKDVEIDQEAISEYTKKGGRVEGLRTMHQDWEPMPQDEEVPMGEKDVISEEMVYGDMPQPDSIVPQLVPSENVNNLVKNAVDSVGRANEPKEKINGIDKPFSFPTRSKKPLSEFSPGYYSKCFPHLFPNGEGDFNDVSDFLKIFHSIIFNYPYNYFFAA